MLKDILKIFKVVEVEKNLKLLSEGTKNLKGMKKPTKKNYKTQAPLSKHPY